jgi:hypothetical protein
VELALVDANMRPHKPLAVLNPDAFPWENRIKWTESEHDWKGTKKQITLLEI